MRSERAQASIEYVGVLLLVAALVGALIGAFGAPSLAARIATSVGQALVGAIGQSDRDQSIGPSASEQGLFDSAVQAGVASDDRPSMRDVRLQLIAAHGDEAGRKIYEQLVLEQLRKVIRELSRPTVVRDCRTRPPGSADTREPSADRRGALAVDEAERGRRR